MSAYFDVIAVEIATGSQRHMAHRLSEENAEAFIKMAVARRGVEQEIYVARPSPDPLAPSQCGGEG